MYLCTYTFSALWIRRKDMVKKTILVYRLQLCTYYSCVLVSVLSLQRNNNALSSILWTTTFACAKLICQIKKCQTYFHTSTYIAVRTEGTHDKSSWMRKISFFCFQQRVWVRPELLNIGQLPAGGQVKQSDANAKSRPPQLLCGQFQHNINHFCCKYCFQVLDVKIIETYITRYLVCSLHFTAGYIV